MCGSCSTAFGADEEISGLRGARELAKVLTRRHLKFEFVLDEGLPVCSALLCSKSAP